jgi:hypothetical protein
LTFKPELTFPNSAILEVAALPVSSDCVRIKTREASSRGTRAPRSSRRRFLRRDDARERAALFRFLFARRVIAPQSATPRVVVDASARVTPSRDATSTSFDFD